MFSICNFLGWKIGRHGAFLLKPCNKERTMKRIRGILLLLLGVCNILPPIRLQAGAGKSFGYFAGGFGAGAIATHLIKKSRRDRYYHRRQPDYVEVRHTYEEPRVSQPQFERQEQRMQQQEERIAQLETQLTREQARSRKLYRKYKQ